MPRPNDDTDTNGPPQTREISPTATGYNVNAATVITGKPVTPTQRILLMSADEWEEFVEEWAFSLTSKFTSVRRVGGSGDMGIDVAGFADTYGFHGNWENFQCKHYKDPLTPGDALIELAKCLWYSFHNHFVPPIKYTFVAPKGCNRTLQYLLDNPEKLKCYLISQWDKKAKNKISTTTEVPLAGSFYKHVDTFDFSIFSFKSALELIDDHSKTRYHVYRFGGGLPSRPAADFPPETYEEKESVYISAILETYEERHNISVEQQSDINAHPELLEHLHRQRVYFFNAESLRNFARDNVPEGTYKHLKEDIYDGVVEIVEAEHPDGLARLENTLSSAAYIPIHGNALCHVVRTRDKKGVCHQLANDKALKWVK